MLCTHLTPKHMSWYIPTYMKLASRQMYHHIGHCVWNITIIVFLHNIYLECAQIMGEMKLRIVF
jgi:hypothetical protein